MTSVVRSYRRVALGVLILVACSDGGVTDPAPVAVASVLVTPTNLSLAPGELGVLSAEPRAADGTPLSGRVVAWSTSDPGVATVSSQGVVTASGVGSTTVTAMVEGRAGTAQVIVEYPPAATIVIVPSNLSLQPGQGGQFTAEARDHRGGPIPNKTFLWVSSNPLVATVGPGGQVAALVPGITTVTASVDGKTGSAELAVVPGPVAAVEVVPSAGTVAVTTSLQLTATARDAGGFVVPGEAVAWVSSAPGIATVSSTGTVTGLVPGGPVTVTATIAGKTAAASLTVVPGPVATVQVTPTATTLEVGQSLELAAVPKDAQGNAVTARPVTWTSSAPAVAPVSSSGGVSALTPGGPVVITATIDGQSGGASVTVIPAAVASVEVRPGVATVDYGGTLQLAALPRSARGDVLTGRLVQWASANPTQVSVSPTGLVTGLASGGPITITATIEGRSAGAAITVARPMAVAVSASGSHSCAIVVSGEAYCWGRNDQGQLGDGSLTLQPTPVRVAGGLSFVAASVGSEDTCGLTSLGRLYCWGWNPWGEVGDGSTSPRSTPVPVSGGLVFQSTSLGQFFSCGVENSGQAYCWGLNAQGQLGDGSGTNHAVPVAVRGGNRFQSIDAGPFHACGVALTGAAYCWGLGGLGQLGQGALTDSPVPAPVAGDHVFQSVSAGFVHTCGVSSTGAAWCWGENDAGELGDGSTSSRSSPGPVGGGLTFQSVSAGYYHTCGVTTTGVAYCWGDNQFGQLGDGSTTRRLGPVVVQGGLRFRTVSAGGGHSCGVTVGGDVYCWGLGGLLGDGSSAQRTRPVLVINLTR